MVVAHTALKICAGRCKKSFATVSALFGNAGAAGRGPLTGVKRKSYSGAVRSAFDPTSDIGRLRFQVWSLQTIPGLTSANTLKPAELDPHQSLSLQFARAEAQASFRLGVKYLMHRQRRRTRYRRTGKTDRMAGQKPKTDLCFRPVPLAQSNLPDRATILNRLQNVVSDSRVDSVVDRSGIFCGRNTRP